MRAWALAATVLTFCAPALADERLDAQGKALYADGKAAFEAGEFQRANDLFLQAYLASEKPELLFNMASSLVALGRPHLAAEKLRAYLRVLPEDPERPAIEQRIRAL